MGFQFLPKSVTLDDTEGPLSTLVSKILVFSEFSTNFWMKMPTLSLSKMQAFWQCKFYTDIHEGRVKTKRGIKMSVQLSTTAISSTVTR